MGSLDNKLILLKWSYRIVFKVLYKITQFSFRNIIREFSYKSKI